MPDDIERIPIVEEEVRVGIRSTVSDRVRVTTHLDEKQVMVREDLSRDVISVRRVAIGIEVPEAPLPQRNGDTLIVPVIEERLVVEKRLFLVEELHIRTETEIEEVEIPVTVRVMRAEVERPPDPRSHDFTTPKPNPEGE